MKKEKMSSKHDVINRILKSGNENKYMEIYYIVKMVLLAEARRTYFILADANITRICFSSR